MSAYALSGTNLVSFDPTNPTVGNTIPITGLTTGEILVGIDFRPQNGFLYGLGVNGANDTATLYVISTQTGVAAALAPGQIAFVQGVPLDLPAGDYGFDFDPTTDRVRVTTPTGLTFRIDPNTGLPIDGQPASIGINPDGLIPADSAISGVAYTNNEPNATAATLYTLDSIFDRLQIQNPPNSGTQTVPVVTTVDISTVNGFDIPAGVDVTTSNAPVTSGSGLALLTVDGAIGLYNVDLVTGVAAKVGDFLDGDTPASGLAIQNDLGGIPAIALSAPGTTLTRFNTATPGTTTSVAITGVGAGDLLVGIDFRPQTGQLYAFGVNAAADTGRLYRIDPNTGAAAALGGGIAFVDAAGSPIDLPAGGYGMDFNPTVDRLRITTATGLNFRINPNDGTAVDGNLGLTPGPAGINPDGAINGGATGVSASAYTNSYGQSLAGGVTTLYTLDSVSNSLFIQNPPNTGTQTAQVAVTLGGSPLDFTSVNGFDIPAGVTVSTANSPAAGFGFAGLTVGGMSSLYAIDLTSGEATNLGAFGTGATQMVGLALGNSPFGAGEDDFYFVDDPADIVVENPNGGFDTVTATIHYGLTPNVERLVLLASVGGPEALQGYGNDLANTLIGTSNADLLNGQAGADVMAGGPGDDVYFADTPGDQIDELDGGGNDAVFASSNFVLPANVETLILTGSGDLSGTGNDLANAIYGNSGNNTLDGEAGADWMAGGAGDDTYFVDGGDAVVENANEGNDTVHSTIHLQLPANVENLTLDGSDDLQGYGDSAANTLVGNTGANLLNGEAGADTMAGGVGNDAYFVDDAGDVVVESVNEGSDSVFSTVDYTLTANVEALVLQGSAVNGTGNALANGIWGNSGDNVLDGQGGADALTGDAGNDTFVFNVGQGDGDLVIDFDGQGAAAGDSLQFVGYGAGATFTTIDAARWQVNFNGGTSHEVITFLNGASIDPTDDVLFS